jgi:hypothetical protein
MESTAQRTLATRKTEENAEAIVDMVAVRRGLDEGVYGRAP